MRIPLLAGSALALMLVSVGQAATLSFTATNQAEADLSLVGTTLTIKLSNLTPVGSTVAGSNLLTGLALIPSISGPGYSLTGQTAAQSFHFTSQTDGTIGGAMATLNWALTSSPNALYFNGFGTGGAPIIGAAATSGDAYAGANSSLTAGPHGDYAYKSATFTITVPNTFSLTAITGANFLFNTNGDVIVPGTPGDGGGSGRDVPLPAAAWSGLALLGGMGALKLRRRAG